jgi:hypothetical protein
MSGTVEMESSPPLSGFGGDTTLWSLRKDGAYISRRRRTSAAGILVQENRYDGGTLTTLLVDGGRTLDRSHKVSDAFIPGGLLPLVLGKLPYEPMAIQTDSLPDPAGWTSADPITLLLEPAFDLPRFAAGSSEAMRCWKVEVSGSGRSSRWYLDSDGRLQVITFGGGIHLQRLETEPTTRPGATQPATAASQPAASPARENP